MGWPLPMSALGQKQTSEHARVMSAYPQKWTLIVGVELLARSGPYPSVREPSLSQAFGKLSEVFWSTEGEHFVQIRDAQRGIEFTQVCDCFMRFTHVTGERIAGCQNAVGSWIVRLLA